MNVLVVYCHPSKKSYTYEILNNLKDSLTEENIPFEISDLYAMDFKSDMDEMEYEREGFGNLSLAIPPDVKEEQEKIDRSDCIIFLYPLWWSDCPAKLKGWFDRVYSFGYAYGYDSSGKKTRQMKSIKYGLAICTAGHPNEFLEEIGMAESMRKIMLDDRLGPRFENKEMLILGGTLDKETVRPIHLDTIKSVGNIVRKHLETKNG